MMEKMSAVTNQTVPRELGALKLLQKGTGSRIFVMTTDLNRHFAIQMVENIRPEQTKSLEKEHSILSELNHPNIVKVLGDLEQKYDLEGTLNTFIKMEFARRSTLFEVKKFFKTINPNVTRSLFKDLSKAMRYLHEVKNISHLDLKLENILMFDDYILKVADFGLSERLEFDQTTEQVKGITQFCGTINYMPPEIIDIKTNYDLQIPAIPYDAKQADVFSFGVTLSLFIFGFLLFENANQNDQNYQHIIDEDWDAIWSDSQVQTVLDELELQDGSLVDELKELFESILAYNPDDRLSFDEILRHPWMTGNLMSPQIYFNNLVQELKLQQQQQLLQQQQQQLQQQQQQQQLLQKQQEKQQKKQAKKN